MPRPPKTVIVVANDLANGLSGLFSILEDQGFRLRRAGTTEELPALLRDSPESVVVAYETPGEDTAHQVLLALAEAEHKTPVVVVARSGDFDEYYELMCEGAYDYFDLRDGADVIGRSVRWAAKAA